MINEPVPPGDRADWLAGQGRVDEAAAVLRQWFRDSADIEPLRQLDALLEEHGRLHETEPDWRAAVAAGLPRARIGLAHLLEDLGRLDEALAEWQALVRDGDRTARRSVGEMLRKLGRLDEAIANHRAMVADGDAAAGSALARMYRQANRPEEAIRAYRAAIAEGGARRWPLGELYDKLGRPDEAITAYRDALVAGEDTARPRLFRSLAAAGRFAEATEVIQASGRGPYLQLGWLLAEQRRFDDLDAEAIRLTERDNLLGLAHLITGAQRNPNYHDDCPPDCQARAKAVPDLPE
ncbi:tetratricopeptide (TPR) repeat protein [Actinoplanes octamycinicus]|uniref:Tetratricopeptide (TPR) repeat protein n=1 Tax=Actinoplanes octamycinicus TaxID=135948 RepID=A0A7W7MB49_9ACTN|nr:tetratricopeptide repeat protein [Actinoplanes octamycinicus]MBB4743490.1 tetratricopeptide (TPR) repeat protein [Actinoplanes octamycinicus]GIE62524.1 hypothetical protein Aoc01nite_79260 [Actinoplanes octamycinicus]